MFTPSSREPLLDARAAKAARKSLHERMCDTHTDSRSARRPSARLVGPNDAGSPRCGHPRPRASNLHRELHAPYHQNVKAAAVTINPHFLFPSLPSLLLVPIPRPVARRLAASRRASRALEKSPIACADGASTPERLAARSRKTAPQPLRPAPRARAGHGSSQTRLLLAMPQLALSRLGDRSKSHADGHDFNGINVF